MKEKQLINHLLAKYRTNHLSEEEYQQFVQLIGKVDLDSEVILDRQARTDWKPSKHILEKIRREEKRIARRARFRQIVWSSAAAVLLVCVAWYLWPQKTPGNLVYQTGFGETQNIELPDGSKVLLNANSRLSWDGEWDKTDLRQVKLQGEAFFDVAKVAHTSFEVVASDIRVKVLGTEFNVRNRNADAEVFLHEGKVDLKVSSKAGKIINMKPGDFVRYDKSTETIMVKENEQMNSKAAWVDGMLEFENKKVRLILGEFEELYGKQFKIENPELADRRMDFSLPYADWELVRKALEIAIGAEFTETRDTIIVK